MEWIIIDDGEDCVEDLFKDVPCVKYFRVEEKMKLGRKRNFMHTKCTGDILVYMDDDDYYPPKRVSHAVSRLMSQPKAVAAGSSIVFIYFNDLEKVFQFGPYGHSHAHHASAQGPLPTSTHVQCVQTWSGALEPDNKKGVVEILPPGFR